MGQEGGDQYGTNKLDKKKIEEVFYRNEEMDHVVVIPSSSVDDPDHLMQIGRSISKPLLQTSILFPAKIEGYSHKRTVLTGVDSRSQLNRSKELLRATNCKMEE